MKMCLNQVKQKLKIPVFLTLSISMFVGIANVQATVIGITGDISLIGAPTSVKLDALTSDTAIFGFNEVNNLTLTTDLFINGSGAGLHIGTGNPATDFILSGTGVDSYFFHVDSVATTATRFFGTASFDREILGIIFERSELNDSDSILGLSGTSYSTLEPNSHFREFERGGPCGISVIDCATISSDLRTITLDLGTTTQIDQIRVVTASVPEPSTILLLGSGLLGLIGYSYRRQKKSA